MKLSLLHHRISNRTLSWLCVALLLLSLMPLYVISFYNHACYDDFGFSIRTHNVWQSTGSVLEVVKEAAANTAGMRNTWQGNYSACFISSLQPALFGENLYWVATFILLTFFLFALWFFLKEVLVCKLGADRPTFWTAFAAIAFVMIQFVPELNEAFFWTNGGVGYTLLWSVMLMRIGVWFRFERVSKTGASVLLYALLLALTIIAGGGAYPNLLFACVLDALLLLFAFVGKHKRRFWMIIPFILLVACLLFSLMAPGNAVRAATLTGGMSAPKAILQAFYFGIALMGNWFSLPLLVVWALVAWQLAEALRGSPLRFNHPIWATILCICLFCTQLAPTLFTGNYLGDGRAIDTYFYTFVLMSCALALYWSGWLMRQMDGKPSVLAIGTAKLDGLRIGAFAVALVLLVVGCISYHPEGSESYGPQNMASGSTLRSLFSGEAERYDAAMDERDAVMTDPSQQNVIMRSIENIPVAFMGDALDSPSLDYVLSLYAEYYDKQSVTTEQKGE